MRLLLWANNVRFMLLLDGLNEFERAQVEAGRKAVRGHLRDYGSHAVHLSCRTADFDAEQEQHPELQVLPEAALWTVQELVDDIAHWDGEGESDVRDYLRFHLGDNARRVYEHLHNDERLATMARIPLFLWMFRLAAERGRASCRRTGANWCAASCARRACWAASPSRRTGPWSSAAWSTLAWRMQQAGSLQSDGDDALRRAGGSHGANAAWSWTRWPAI